jgi:hypothetical protein
LSGPFGARNYILNNYEYNEPFPHNEETLNEEETAHCYAMILKLARISNCAE